MHNLLGLLHTAENKIIILGTVKFPAKSAHFPYQLPSGNKKMADIIIGTKKINVKIRL